MKNPKYQIFKGKDKKFYFRLKSGNGQTVLQSQGYANKAGVKRGIKSVQTNSSNDKRFDVKEAKNGQMHFSLLAANKNIVGSSEMYKSKKSLKNGMETVKKNADAPVEDLTEDTTKSTNKKSTSTAKKATAKTKAADKKSPAKKTAAKKMTAATKTTAAKKTAAKKPTTTKKKATSKTKAAPKSKAKNTAKKGGN